MSNNPPKAVTTLIFAAAAVSIGYRIATSPERRSQNNTPAETMRPRTRRNVKLFEPEDDILTPQGDRQRRRSGKSFEPEDGILTPGGTEDMRRVSSYSSRPSRRRVREQSDEIKQESDNERRISDIPPRSPSTSSRPPSRHRSSTRSPTRSLSRRRQSSSRSLPELKPGVRERIGRWLGLTRDEHSAYCIGITLLIIAIAVMTGVDRLHEAQRARLPSTITSVLFVRPIETYVALQKDLETLNRNVASSVAKVDSFAKLVPKCTWHDIKDSHSMDQCRYDGLLHEVKAELIKTKLRSFALAGKEVDRICQTLSLLELDLEQAVDDQQLADVAVKELMAEREQNALAIVNAINIDSKLISAIHIKTSMLQNSSDKLQGAIPKKGQFTDPDLLKAKHKEVFLHLSEVQESLDLSLSTPLGRTQENMIDETLRLANKFGDLHRWLVGREVDPLKLEKQLQVIRQNPLIKRTCDENQHEVLKKHVDSGEKPLIPWGAFKKEAICERFCGREAGLLDL